MLIYKDKSVGICSLWHGPENALLMVQIMSYMPQFHILHLIAASVFHSFTHFASVLWTCRENINVHLHVTLHNYTIHEFPFVFSTVSNWLKSSNKSYAMHLCSYLSLWFEYKEFHLENENVKRGFQRWFIVKKIYFSEIIVQT